MSGDGRLRDQIVEFGHSLFDRGITAGKAERLALVGVEAGDDRRAVDGEPRELARVEEVRAGLGVGG